MFLLYNLAVALTAPIWLPYAWLRARRRKEAVRWGERMGRYKVMPGPDRIWVHAVSVGEVHASVPLLRELRARLPTYEILLSTTTSSGQQVARDGAKGLYDHLVYFPMDVANFCLNAMIHVRPQAVVIMETELWLNFLWAAKVVGARTFVVNGRVSDRSFPRAMRLRWFYRRLLGYVDRCLMQSETDRERIAALGAPSERVAALGNTKFDQAVAGEVGGEEARLEFGVPQGTPCVVAGSTRSLEEERLVLQAIHRAREALPGLFFILAPRHIERAEDVAAAIAAAGLRCKRRSCPDAEQPGQADCLLLDTFGELARAYAAGDVAVVGGGFGGFGGQNIFQPLALGKPTLFGPSMQNFRDIAELAVREGVGFQVETAEELGSELTRLLRGPAARAEIASKAQRLVRANQGASARIAEEVVSALAGR
jgi:3-deoxy-D-manno-octulosonic-acid transferase